MNVCIFSVTFTLQPERSIKFIVSCSLPYLSYPEPSCFPVSFFFVLEKAKSPQKEIKFSVQFISCDFKHFFELNILFAMKLYCFMFNSSVQTYCQGTSVRSTTDVKLLVGF